MASAAWIFPGQGSQRAGMGREAIERSAAAADAFAEVDDALGYKLSELILNGPESELISTRVQQPAILAASVAYFRALDENGALPEPRYVAGHSLGEYSALVAAGALDLADAACLVQRRGELMETHGLGGMLAVIGLELETLIQIASECDVEIANFNAPGQITLSGRSENLERAAELAADTGARRVIVLPVNGAFHSSLMQPVADALWSDIQQVDMCEPIAPLLANVYARPLTDPDDLRAELRDQITASVQWVDIVNRARDDGVDHFYEIGPGKILAGLVPRIRKGCRVSTAEQLFSANS